MARLKLPAHIRQLNPDLGAEVDLPPRRRAAMADRRGLFGELWALHGGPGPAPVEGYKFMRARGFEFDWAWPGEWVAVEVDGGQWAPGGGRHARDSDRWKIAEAMADGWMVFRFSPQQLEDDPLRALGLVRRALGREDE